jgi:isopenicillin-N N-acyltransferase-like protein
MTFPIVRLSGSAYEQGLQHGRRLRQHIHHNIEVYFDRFLQEGALTRPEVLERARRYAGAIKEQNSNYESGMRGIAEGAELSFEEIVALNVRYEILYYQFAVREMASQDGCTAFAVAPSRSENGHLLMGQNWDWIPDVAGALLLTGTPGEHQVLSFTEAGIFGGKIGFNSAGLGLVINGITTTEDDWTLLGRPFHLRCYEILQQRSLEEAVQAATGGDTSCSANFLIAALPDRAVDIEVAPRTANQLGWQDGCLVHANHFVEPDKLGIREPSEEIRGYSCRRQERMEAQLRQHNRISVDAILDTLRDHANPPRSICRHVDRSAPVDEQYETVTSIVIDLHEGSMLVSDGPPCENEYTDIRLEALE